MKTTGRIILLAIAVVAACAATFIALPTDIEPAAWHPEPAPKMEGPYAQNNLLSAATLHTTQGMVGPEDIARDAEGRYYTGVADGRILRFTGGMAFSEFVNTGGRPLGMQFDADGNLIVCDAHKGLLSIDKGGVITTLATEHGGTPFGFTDDLDIASDGAIYFTDASSKFHAPNYLADLIEHQGNGRFLKYDPATEKVSLLIDELCFANGVALSSDESFVLVNETWNYRVLRYWLTGIKSGTWDVFIDNLPGFPDNISRSPRGTFWLALANPRNADADMLAPYPMIRRALWKMPSLLPAATRYSFVLGLNADGEVVHNLQDPSGRIAPVTSVNEFDGMLFLGSVEDIQFATIPAPEES